MPHFRLMLLAIFIFCFSVLPALASDCTTPVLLYQLNGTGPNTGYAFSLDVIGDINGDGKTDFVVGEAGASPNGIYRAGAAYVFSGADGNLIYQINGTSGGENLGQAMVGLGDINNDGKPDFIIRASTYVRVYSAPDSLLLYQINIPPDTYHTLYGAPFAATADVNGDGTAELIFGITSLASAFVYSGTGDSLLYQINGSSEDLFGFSVSAIGDIDNDGNTDFAVGAPCADTLPGYYTCNGAVYIYSGVDGILLRQVKGTNKNELLGWSVSPVTDLDKDGKTDFIVGAPLDERWTYPLSDSDYAYVEAFSATTGTPIYKIRGKGLNHFGSAVRGVGDVNGDGTPDFAVGEHGDGDAVQPDGDYFGTVFVYSGLDGNLIYRVRSHRPYDNFGFSLASPGDLNGDGKADIIVGDYGAGLIDSGKVYTFVSKTVPKGDLNFDSTLTIADVTNLLNAVFIDPSLAFSPCTADLNCDGAFAPGDVVLLLNRVFLQTALPCQ